MHALAVTTIYQLDSRLTQKEENLVWYWKSNQLRKTSDILCLRGERRAAALLN